MTLVRQASTADFVRFYERSVPEIWLGMVAERDGELIGFGLVVWDDLGRALAIFDRKADFSAFTMHRVAKRVLSALKEADEPVIYAYCDTHIPGASKWLRRLGFVPTGTEIDGQVLYERP